VRFAWDDEKNASNRRKHGVTFEVASAVFYDPLHSTTYDGVVNGEDRWSTVGMVGNRYLMMVAHTLEDEDGELVRIISAREATPHERRTYEDDL
jgi:uncharacterized DUF497 family protein